MATAGTTNAGIIDDLAPIADVCEATGIWMHVDGAYGLAALASPTARPLFVGIERADSFIVDPHKWLFAPYDCCALVSEIPSLVPPPMPKWRPISTRSTERPGIRPTTPSI
ncbi:MAG: pyridoxal-dependent decarboxylase [Acidimicrobiales bacterium]